MIRSHFPSLKTCLEANKGKEREREKEWEKGYFQLVLLFAY